MAATCHSNWTNSQVQSHRIRLLRSQMGETSQVSFLSFVTSRKAVSECLCALAHS